MKSKIIKLIILIFVLVLIYMPISVYYPKYFIEGGTKSSFNIDLKEFSILNPKYVVYDLDSASNKYEVMFIELTRNWNLLWKYDKTKSTYAYLPKNDLVKFKDELKNNSVSDNKKIIENSKVLIQDKLQIFETDTPEEIDYKQSFSGPNRENSTQYNLEKFKLLAKGDKWNNILLKVGDGDFGLGPDKFYPDGNRVEYSIGSPKIQFAFLSFKEGYPYVDEESKTTFGLLDIGFVTQRQERVIVPVNPDGTYNWEAIKDKID
jgi:hypothetical protein